MKTLKQNLAAAADANRDIQHLLRAMGVLLGLCEGRLALGLNTSPVDAAQVRAMAQDSGTLHDLCHILIEVSLGIADIGRASIEEATVLIAGTIDPKVDLLVDSRRCHGCLQALTTSINAVLEVRQGVHAMRQTLDEAARRQDSSLVQTEVARLLARLKTSAAARTSDP